MNKYETFDEIYDRLKASPKDWNKINKTKKELTNLIMNSFVGEGSFKDHKYFGSTESGTSIKWESDIDYMLAFSPYNSDKFKEGISKILDLKDLEFRKSSVVPDIATAKFNGEKLGIVGIEYGKDKILDLQGDIWYHPEFSKKMLNSSQQRDVILGKIFLKTLGLPKKSLAEGFVMEQLIAKYKTFDNFLQAISTGKNMQVDFSGKYSGEKTPLVVSYPYSGLGNLAKNLTKEDWKKSSEYAKEILENPLKFLEDSVTGFNHYLWQERAKKLGKREEFGSPDIYLTRRENRIIGKKLKDDSAKEILDLGCANGYSTIKIGKNLQGKIVGLDANEDAIRYANELKNKRENIEFKVGVMENLPFENNSFDSVLMKRALGNIPSRKLQAKALDEAGRVLRKGGTFYLFDATSDSIRNLSGSREMLGLPKLVQPNHTYVMCNNELFESTKNLFDLREIIDKTSTYQYLTKVGYPFVYQLFGGDLNKLKFDTLFHKIVSFLPSIGNKGISKLYIFKKK